MAEASRSIWAKVLNHLKRVHDFCQRGVRILMSRGEGIDGARQYILDFRCSVVDDTEPTNQYTCKFLIAVQ